MNDTFDDFTFADLEIDGKVITKSQDRKSAPKIEVSFDDSLFLNSGSFQTPTEIVEENGNKNNEKVTFNLKLSLNESPKNNSQINDKNLINTLSNGVNAEKSLNNSNSDFILDESIDFNLISTPKDESKTSQVHTQSYAQHESTVENKISIESPTVKVQNSTSRTPDMDELNKGLKNTKIVTQEIVEKSSRKILKTYSTHSKVNQTINAKNESELKPEHCDGSTLSQKFKELSVREHMLELSQWGLPSSILEKYGSRNITKMFPWQVECLRNRKVLQDHANLVYSAPTSAGKTLVAEILTVKTVLERGKKVVFILPFVSVVREKMFYFQDIFGTSGVRVEGFMGSYNPPGGFASVKVAICTIEKANSLINKLLQEKNLAELGAVVIDEMHLLGDPSRGYLLELLLTKIKYMSQRDPDCRIQIVGMSATLPNLDLLASWLSAELYVTSFRPIPLYERAHVCGDVYTEKWELVRSVTALPELDTDVDNVLQLCLETINQSCSVLIFCPTKQWCESLSLQISQAFRKLGCSKTDLGERLRSQIKSDCILEVLEQLKCCPVGLDDVLRRTVSFGVSFHHAGLTMDERDIVEGAFRSGAIRVLVATSTLSSGVNLPAKRVVIRTPIFHGKPLDELTYRQMIGRAGRMGRDTSGESVLICQKNEAHIARTLMEAQLPPIESCLVLGGRLKRAILEIVASEVASTPSDVELFTRCTLLSHQDMKGEDNEGNPIEDSLQFLTKHEFLRLQETGDGVKYIATSLGKACLSSSVPPEDGLALFTELEKARKCLVLDTELHLIYLVTPYSACHQWANLDWMMFLNFWERLPSSMRKVGELVGVKESYLIGAARGKVQTNTPATYHKCLVHKRFFVALALQDLVNEKSLCEVCAKFACNRGMLQSLQQSAATFAGMVTAFSKQLGWTNVEILISQFQHRLHFGVGRDLLDLMRLPFLNGKSARLLFNAGFETLVQLANSTVERIENVLHKAVPFERGTRREDETDDDLKERNRFRTIWITGKEGLTEREAAEFLLDSARNYLQLEMGLQEAKWTKKEEEHDSVLGQPSISRLSLTDLFDGVDENVKEKSVNSSSDFIETSQDELFSPMVFSKKRPRISDLASFLQSPRKKSRVVQTSNIEKLEVVDVSSSEALYDTFCKELETKYEIAVSVAFANIERRKMLIGVENVKAIPENENFTHKNKTIVGFAVTWGECTVYYLDINRQEKCVNAVKRIFASEKLTVRMFNFKEQVHLMSCLNVDCRAKFEDPSIGDWLLEPDGREKHLQALVLAYYPSIIGLFHAYGNSDVPRLRFCSEALIIWYICPRIKEKLIENSNKFLRVYDTEMECVKVLASVELNGIGVDQSQFTNMIDRLNREKVTIETKAYGLAGRRFSFASSKEVAKVLHLAKGSTKKSVLEKNTNPISALVLLWRKINAVITKTIQPLVYSIEGDRLYGNYIVHTATGRISMQDPNLQNVAKNFDIDNNVTISCRDAFAARKGFVMVSADYCQLELRLLAHLSQETKLCSTMRRSGDIFRSMAAQWNDITQDQVTDCLRQRCKQISYAIIYGMGVKSLSEQLAVKEEEADRFLQTFREAYPGIETYTRSVVERCRKNGFVETITGRRRYLPNILSSNVTLKNQAERQAVNTTIQGSAADLVKTAMIHLENGSSKLKYGQLMVLHLHDELLYEVPEENTKKFISFLKNTMEASIKLSIPFPVKIKTGPSWGQLVECCP